MLSEKEIQMFVEKVEMIGLRRQRDMLLDVLAKLLRNPQSAGLQQEAQDVIAKIEENTL